MNGCARIHEAEVVKAYMSREDLIKVFNPASVHGQLERFVLKSSELIVVDVVFGTANFETGLRPPDRSIPILMITEPMLAPSKTLLTPPPAGTHAAWLLDRIRDIETVHPGMTLTDFQKLFSQIGGLSDGHQYDLHRCIYITVDINFTHHGLPYSHKNLEKQKLISISQPFLTYHKYMD